MSHPAFDSDRPRIHLAHDWLVGLRGGERVLDRFARLFGPTTLYTLVAGRRPITAAIDGCRIMTSPLQWLPGANGSLRRWYLPLMPWAVGALHVLGQEHVDGCDLLLSTSSAVMKSIRPPAGVPHVCYCHSPARYLWDQASDYAHGRGGGVRALGLRTLRSPLRSWDRRTASRVTHFIANSAHTARRIEQCYGREAEIIHPPVRTEFFTPDEAVRREAWFLVACALEPYKRVDLVIDAAKQGGWPLKIAGSGTQMKALEARASGCGHIEMLGRVSDETMRELFRSARALIHPQLEDFGITAVEAQACGCPVIAFGAGGALDTVASETGLLFQEQSSEALGNAVRAFDRASFYWRAIRAHAERFGEARFDAAIMQCVLDVGRRWPARS